MQPETRARLATMPSGPLSQTTTGKIARVYRHCARPRVGTKHRVKISKLYSRFTGLARPENPAARLKISRARADWPWTPASGARRARAGACVKKTRPRCAHNHAGGGGAARWLQMRCENIEIRPTPATARLNRMIFPERSSIRVCGPVWARVISHTCGAKAFLCSADLLVVMGEVTSFLGWCRGANLWSADNVEVQCHFL